MATTRTKPAPKPKPSKAKPKADDVRAAVYNVFNVQRHLISRATLRRFRAAAHHAWNDATTMA